MKFKTGFPGVANRGDTVYLVRSDTHYSTHQSQTQTEAEALAKAMAAHLDGTTNGVCIGGDFVKRPTAIQHGTVIMSHGFYIDLMGLSWLPTRHRLLRKLRKEKRVCVPM